MTVLKTGLRHAKRSYHTSLFRELEFSALFLSETQKRLATATYPTTIISHLQLLETKWLAQPFCCQSQLPPTCSKISKIDSVYSCSHLRDRQIAYEWLIAKEDVSVKQVSTAIQSKASDSACLIAGGSVYCRRWSSVVELYIRRPCNEILVEYFLSNYFRASTLPYHNHLSFVVL